MRTFSTARRVSICFDKKLRECGRNGGGAAQFDFSTLFHVNSKNNIDDKDDAVDWMVRFKQAKIQFAAASIVEGDQSLQEKQSLSVDLDILRTGGHLLVGSNGAGKSLLLRSLIAQESVINTVSEDKTCFLHRNDSRRPLVSHVSFESHQELLLEAAASTKGRSTYAVLSPGGHFSKTAEFLVVRFGLYPILYRDVRTLSTGEIRKVMLIRALVQSPRILILDNAFDGLDVTSRSILKDIVRKTIAGFRMDILVQGVSAQTVPAMQVVLATHRSEEVIDNITRISVLNGKGSLKTYDTKGMPIDQMIKTHGHGMGSNVEDGGEAWNAKELPAVEALKDLLPEKDEPGLDEALVTMVDLEVKSGDRTLLHQLTWTIGRGQRWFIAGGNGAGKSTLSRLLAHPSSASIYSQSNLKFSLADEDIGWVSTERHMKLSTSNLSAAAILSEGNKASDELAALIRRWFNLNGPDRRRPFAELSQGEQKVLLIANALLKLPKLLILDEPLQGLDNMNRRKVLSLVELWCQASRMSFIYITHHLEEVIPSIQSVIHLSEGHTVYNGDFASYDPSLL